MATDSLPQTTAPAQGASLPREPRAWLWEPLLIFGVSRFVLFVLAAFAQSIFPLANKAAPDPYGQPPLLSHWLRWDAGWYLSIVNHGYGFDPVTHIGSVAFYPLYPILVWAVSRLTGDAPAVAVILPNVFFALALIFLYRLVERKLNRRIAQRTVLFLTLFPFAFFYSAAYTESLFLLLATLSFLAAENDRWWVSGILGFLCALSRPTGIILGPTLLLLYLEKRHFQWRKLDWRVLSVGLIPLGTVLYAAYLGLVFSDPFAAFQASEIGWKHYNVFVDGFARLDPFTFGPSDYNFVLALNVLVTVIWILSAIPTFRLLGPGYACFVLLGAALPFSTVTESLGRYVSVVFPTFIVIAYYLRNRTMELYLLAGGAALLALFTVLFADSYWIV